VARSRQRLGSLRKDRLAIFPAVIALAYEYETSAGPAFVM